MKILFVSALLPYPPSQGGQVRMYNLLKILATRHDVTLLSFIREEEEKEYRAKFPFCKHVTMVMRGNAWQAKYILKAGFSTKPFLYATYDNELMKSAIADELAHTPYDLIHLEPSYVWPSLPRTDIPVVVTEHNIESTIYNGFVQRYPLVFLRPLLYLDVLKLIRWEQIIWKHADHIVTVSDPDAAVVGRFIPSGQVSVVPNGVDTDLFVYKPKKTLSTKRILFVGFFGWLQNRDALSYLLDVLWPKIHAVHPDATLHVVGRKLTDHLQKKLLETGGSYLPNVEHIVPQYHNADILLAPIRVGGGTRYKILEAMATGLPVVTTTIGAAGLAVVHKRDLLIGDTPGELTQAVTDVFTQRQLKNTLTQNARKIIEKNYSWDRLAKKLEDVWKHEYR